MPNDRAFVRAERRLRSVLGCTHAALSSPLPAALIHNENFNLRWINATSVEKLRFRFLEDKREASIDHARKRDPFRKDYGERRTVGENDFLEIAKGAAAVKLASLQLGRIRRNGGGERVRTERQRANFRFYRAAIRARDISSVVVPFDLVAALRKGEWDLSARGAG